MMWVVVAVALAIAWAVFFAWALRPGLTFRQEIEAAIRAVQEKADQQDRFEFYKWALNRESFLLLYADMPEVIEREVGPEHWHSLLCHWGLPPSNAELWR